MTTFPARPLLMLVWSEYQNVIRKRTELQPYNNSSSPGPYSCCSERVECYRISSNIMASSKSTGAVLWSGSMCLTMQCSHRRQVLPSMILEAVGLHILHQHS